MSWTAGAYDVHAHASPSLFPRWGDGWEVAEACRGAGMQGVVLKSHHGSTCETAALVRRRLPGLDIFGGTTLNHFVGGLNPMAVQACMALGGRVVWLPTLHAANHARSVGPLGGFGFQQARIAGPAGEGIQLLADNGELVKPVQEILTLLHRQPVVLATGHISRDEIVALVHAIEHNGLDLHLLINHVCFHAPRLDVDELRALQRPWVWFEMCYFSMSPLARATTAADMARRLRALPEAQWVLASDAGQPQSPAAPEALAELAAALVAAGAGGPLVQRALREQPRVLLFL